MLCVHSCSSVSMSSASWVPGGGWLPSCEVLAREDPALNVLLNGENAKLRILRSSGPSVKVFALFSAPLGRPAGLYRLFFPTIVHSSVSCTSYVSLTLLILDSSAARTGKRLSFILRVSFALSASLYLAGHACDQDICSPPSHAAHRLCVACVLSAHCSVMCPPPQYPHFC